MYKVTVLMPTYNHEQYIGQAIESYINQECSFSTLLLISDDCSTDHTLSIAQDWAQKYPDRIKVISNPNNLGLIPNYKQLIDLASSEYIAILESDDYWIDSRKLQMQVDFLNKNSDFGIVYTDHIVIDDFGNESLSWCSKFNPVTQGDIYDSLVRRNPICAATVMMRKSLIDKHCHLQDYINNRFRTFDYVVYLTLSRFSKVHFIDIKTATYRSLSTSISNSASWSKLLDFNKNMYEIRSYVIEKFGYPSSISKNSIDLWKYKRLAYIAYKYNRYLDMSQYTLKYLYKLCQNIYS